MLKDIVSRIDQRLEATGLDPTTACRTAGLNPGAIRDLRRAVEGKKTSNSVRMRTLEALAPVLNTTAAWLYGGDEAAAPTQGSAPLRMQREDRAQFIPVLGTAAASLGDGAFQFASDPIEYVPAPPGLLGARDVYALYVENESMSPAHRHGDLRFAHPGRVPRKGDTVIVQVQTHKTAPVQAYIKNFLRRDGIFVACEQLNPLATIEFKADTVIAIHKVLTTNELFGV